MSVNSLKKLLNLLIIFFSYKTVQMAKFPEISYIFNQRGSSLGRHVNAASLKSLEIQALVYHKNQEPI